MATPAAPEEKRAPPENETPVQDLDNAVQLAHDVDDAAYSPWTKGLIKLYIVLIIPYLCGCLNGYDGSLMGGIIGMDSYQSIFKM
jgi:hypothetical protein